MGKEIVKIREYVEKPIYMDNEIDKLSRLIHIDTYNIGWDTIVRIADEINMAVPDLCRLLGIYGDTKLERVRNGKQRLPYQDRLVVYLFDALFEYKPSLKSVLFGRTRSYWSGYVEAGGKLPKDMKKFMDYTDPIPLDMKLYRQGVLDYNQERIYNNSIKEREENDE